MKSQVLLFACLAFLIIALACGGGSKSGGNSSTPGVGAPGSGNGGGNGGGTGGSGSGSGGSTSGSTTGSGSGSGSGSSSGGGSGSGGGTGGSGGSGSGSGGSGSSSGGTGGGTSPTSLLYVIENPSGASNVEAFSIGSTGALTQVSSTSAGMDANFIAADSKFVFVSDSPGCCAGNPPIVLFSYSIGSSGALTLANQFTNSNDNTDTVSGLTLDSTGTHLYMSASELMSSGNILALAVDSSGKMSPIGPQTQTEEIPGRLVITADGRTVYNAMVRRRMTADSGGYDILTRDPATGMLTDQNRFFVSPDPCCEFFLDSALALGGQFLLGVSPKQQIVVYSVNSATGDLTIASALNGDFEGLTVDNTGKFAIVTHASGAVGSYQINPDGTLTFIGSLGAAAGVNNLVMDPSNQFVYVENSNAPQIFAFTFNASNGVLGNAAGSPFTTSGMPVRMAAVGR